MLSVLAEAQLSVPTYLCPNGKLLFSLPNEEALKYIINLSSAMTMETHGKAAQTTLPCSSQRLCKEVHKAVVINNC